MEAMSTHPVTPETHAPHPTLAQLVEGAVQKMNAALGPGDGLTNEELRALLVFHLSPEWERMGRENEAAWKEAKKWQDMGAFLDARKDELAQEVSSLRTENERLTRERLTLQEELGLKLAACDCAAIMDTEESHAKNKDVAPGNPSWSPAFDSVMRRTTECITLRTRLRELEGRVKELEVENASMGQHLGHLNAEKATIESQLKQTREDKARLDWLEVQGVRGLLWEARRSTTGRGYRLHQHGPFTIAGYKTARQAIDAARKEGERDRLP